MTGGDEAVGDKRAAPRQRTLKGARIVINNAQSTFTCTVRNLSETGARIKVTSQLGIPDAFLLVFDDGRRAECRVAWRKADEIGVAFL